MTQESARLEVCFNGDIAVRPISMLRFWISEGLTQAYVFKLRGEHFRSIGDLPECLSREILLSRDDVSREIELTRGISVHVRVQRMRSSTWAGACGCIRDYLQRAQVSQMGRI